MKSLSKCSSGRARLNTLHAVYAAKWHNVSDFFAAGTEMTCVRITTNQRGGVALRKGAWEMRMQIESAKTSAVVRLLISIGFTKCSQIGGYTDICRIMC